MSRMVLHSLAVVALALAASPVLAGPLGIDANGLVGFTGNQAFNSDAMHATLDYAVFAPGHYTGLDPSQGTEYVYAYQVFNTSTTRTINAFTVGLLDNNGAHGQAGDPLYSDGSSVAPFFINLNPASSVVATFLNLPPIASEVPAGGHSQVVVFASPYAPTFASASVQSGGLVDQHLAPTPLPEPATLGLLGLGGLGLLRRRRSC